MQLKINKSSVDRLRDNAKDLSKRIYGFDTELNGFGCMATPTGATSFFVEYRHDGRKRRKTIGRYGPLTPHQARNMAQALLGDVARGVDVASKPVSKSSVEHVFQEFYKHHANPTRYWHELKLRVYREAESLLKRDIKSVVRADIALLVDSVSLRSKSAGRSLFAALRPMFRWAVERGYIESSPCGEIKPPPTTRIRDRILTDEELVDIWNASTESGFPFSQFVKLLILTGARRNEVAGIAWSEIKGDVWRIDGSRTKNGKLHEIDLHPLATEFLRDIPKTSDLMLSSNGRTPPSGFSKAKKKLDAELPKRMQHWRFHDLRRTCASGMAAMGILPNVIERILNHRSGSNSGLVSVYQRHEYRQERRDAIMKWGDHVRRLIGEEGD